MSPSRRRATARGGSPPRCAAWHPAHAESFACRGSVRGTVRVRAAHPARCHNRAAITPAKFARPRGTAHYPGGAMGTSRPTAITPAKFARTLPTRIMHGHGAMRRDIRPRWLTAAPYRHYARKIRTALSHAIYAFERTARVPWCGPVAVRRDAWPLSPVGAPHPRLRALATPVLLLDDSFFF